jgi:hypothetical protein
MTGNNNLNPPADNDDEPEIAADDAGATTMAEKMAKKAPDGQVDDAEKRRLAEEASRQSDA